MQNENLNPETLAKAFSAVLAEWLTPEQRLEVVSLNKGASNPHICYSHDYCDANQAMIDALERSGAEFDCENDAQGKLIDEAWDIAKANQFWF